MSDGIAALDIAVVGDDTLWVVDLMNTLAVRSDGAYVREFVTLLDAVDDLTPGHPTVVLFAPLLPPAPPDPDAEAATEAAATDPTPPSDPTNGLEAMIAAWPDIAFVFTVDEATASNAAALEAMTGIAPPPADAIDTIVTTVLDALADRRGRATAFGFDAGRRAIAAQAASDALINGPTSSMRIVMVTSAKGGTGATTVAINLAAALVELGSRVTVVDAHGATGDVGFLLGLAKPERIALDGVELDRHSLPHYTSVHPGTDVRAVILPTDENQLAAISPRQLLEVLVALGEHTDVVVIDLPVGLLVSSDLATFAAKILIVTTSQLASLKNAHIAADVIGRSHKLGLIRNDASPASIDHGRAALEDSLQVELLAELPYDDTIAKGATADPIVSISKPKSKFSRSMRDLADSLLVGGLRPDEGDDDDGPDRASRRS